MPATRTLRQIVNGQLRSAGVAASDSYHTRIGPLDIVRLHVVEPDAEPREFTARVRNVEDHGWYLVVEYGPVKRGDGVRPGSVRVYREGPSDWGVVAVQIIRKVARIIPREGRY